MKKILKYPGGVGELKFKKKFWKRKVSSMEKQKLTIATLRCFNQENFKYQVSKYWIKI